MCGFKSLLISETQLSEYLIEMVGEIILETWFELMTFGSDTILNHHLEKEMSIII